MPNYANDTKAKAKLTPVSSSAKSTDRGTRYAGIIDKMETTYYSTGSFGIKVKYVVEGVERAVYENIVLKTVDKATGNLVPTKYGEQTLFRRLTAAGLTSDEINAFKVPQAKTDGEEFAPLIGAGLAIYLSPREYMGKPTFDVKSTWPLDNNK